MTDFDWLAVGGRLCLDCDFLMQIRPGDKAEVCWSCQTEKAKAGAALRSQTYRLVPCLSPMAAMSAALGIVGGQRSGAPSTQTQRPAQP